MEIGNILVIFIAALIGSFYGTLVGGASLITIPALIFSGLSPHIALATNRLGVSGVHVAGIYKFGKNKLIDYRLGFIAAIVVAVGSIIGANLVLLVSEILLKRIIAIAMVIVLLVILLNKQKGLEKIKEIKKSNYLIGLISFFFIGIYGGFYGAGTGTMMSYALILLFGKTFLESAGTRKIPSLTINIVAASVFIYFGKINYFVVGILFLSTFIGSYFGSALAPKMGNKGLKWLFAIIVIIMSIKLLM